ncbi:NAD(P)H nitroreductase [Colwellia sp. E2M01]|uniref:NAD(P)H nitroreductase n=1 Tax=Colwellia sp. E2M01 TaxID=2841561 RepID=UPI001C0863F9|nr:NAD(P)H nitroreductase [Colwellia sp. E2M01]MBU2870564.1 NAD(P)H nitroreductase [Colwellia sp. E2M01]
MTAIELLLQRQSTPMLTEPAPNDADLSTLLAAGMRAPDHGGLKPWHFHVISGQGLQQLSDLYLEAISVELAHSDLEDQAIIDKKAKTAKMPFRAPMLIVISTNYAEHSKVPKQEQLVAAGCCAHAMQMAAFSLGYGAMWRTGDLAYNNIVKAGLSIEGNNDIVGFLYVGTPTKEAGVKPAKDYQEHVTYWQ